MKKFILVSTSDLDFSQFNFTFFVRYAYVSTRTGQKNNLREKHVHILVIRRSFLHFDCNLIQITFSFETVKP